jgi:hypothetical protein
LHVKLAAIGKIMVLPRMGMTVVWLPKDSRWRRTKVAGAAVVYALAGDEPAADQSQNEPHDETHIASQDRNSA